MPWYSMYHPSMIDPVVIIYIQEMWYFKKTPILVVLDPRGKVVNHDLSMCFGFGEALHSFSLATERHPFGKKRLGELSF
ncbi:hypothetical protein Patl1_33332 [Pistacia atlantica]|uniref:Uncharacterized protein n=1 Tax=Pistacia atlantica TaxID=434234 RepID=A0ACC0ZUP5_9ROSI|nr:hypothetical protein Patl1_33332 [Pistacia atlantica]